MKKILLTVFLIMAIFQLVVMATAIDIGNAAINRGTGVNSATLVDKNNPANATGTITSVEVWATTAMTGLEIATFYIVSGNNLSTRDNETIGNVAIGYNKFNVTLAVNAGDYIGMYFVTGTASRDSTAGDGRWTRAGDNIPCTNTAFTLTANRMISLYGTGATAEASNAIMFGINF